MKTTKSYLEKENFHINMFFIKSKNPSKKTAVFRILAKKNKNIL